MQVLIAYAAKKMRSCDGRAHAGPCTIQYFCPLLDTAKHHDFHQCDIALFVLPVRLMKADDYVGRLLMIEQIANGTKNVMFAV